MQISTSNSLEKAMVPRSWSVRQYWFDPQLDCNTFQWTYQKSSLCHQQFNSFSEFLIDMLLITSASSVDPDQSAHISLVWSECALFAFQSKK